MKLRHFIAFSILSVTVISCGPKSTSEMGKLKNATAKKVIKRHEGSEPEFKTLQANLRGTYDDGSEKQSIGISMRIKKNDTIWLSAKLAGMIPLAKALITPDRVQFYDKINHRSFDGDFRLLSHWLGADINFKKLQDLLLGQSVYPLKKNDYNLETSEKGYQLTGLDKSETEKSFLVDKSIFRLKEQKVGRPLDNKSLTVSYGDYKEKNKLVFPGKINIIAKQNRDRTTIRIKYRKLDFNEPVRFPFKMPSDYKEIQI